VALHLLERWLDNMRADSSLGVVAARPGNATDRCYDQDGGLIASGAGAWDGVWNGVAEGDCSKLFPHFSNPRLIAGDDFAGDIFKCHLRTIDAAIADGTYAPIDVSLYRDELQRIFPQGVCDYSLGDAARPAGIL
jgi:hypothetical protein